MRLAVLAVLALMGVSLLVAGVALIYPPAAMIVAGVLVLGLAFITEVRDT